MKHKNYDFIGVIGNNKFFMDVKFYKSEYRLKGFVETSAWGKETGIFAQARQTKEACYLALLHKGEYHIVDVHKLQRGIDRGQIQTRLGKSYDGGKECPTTYVVMDDFKDGRFTKFSGKMDKEAFLSLVKVSSLKNMSIDDWFKGDYIER
jgi:hypothetical protein